jgi:hypothetical protein
VCNIIDCSTSAVIAGGICNFLGSFSGCSTISGGYKNTINNTSPFSSISGGVCNSICGNRSTIVSGEFNTIYSDSSVILGGYGNQTCGCRGVVLGGCNNTATADTAVFGIGLCNTQPCTIMSNNFVVGDFVACGGLGCNVSIDACGKMCLQSAAASVMVAGSGVCSIVGSGCSNNACGDYSFVGGGSCNTASAIHSTTSGGYCNTASSYGTFVGGGCLNTSSSYGTFVGGGLCNTASAAYSVVVGGFCNISCGCYGAILGGLCNNAFGACSFVGGGISNTAACDFTGVFGCGLCNTQPCTFMSNNFVVGDFVACGGCGCNITIDANGKMCLQSAAASVMVAGCGLCSIVGSGCNNVTCGDFSFVGGGECNATNCNYSIVLGGCCNTSYTPFSTIVGGFCNKDCNANFGCSFIGGGQQNLIELGFGWNSIVGGLRNTVTCSLYSSIVGGHCNLICYTGGLSGKSTISGGYCNIMEASTSSIGGGTCNKITISSNSFIGSGANNCITTGQSFIVGGNANVICGGGDSMIGSGVGNVLCGSSSIIASGYFSTLCANYSTISGGYCNINCGGFTFLGSGKCNTISSVYSDYATLVGGCGNTISCGYGSTILGGCGNSLCCNYSAILGGCGNIVCNTFSAAFGCGLTASAACTFYVNNLCVCGTLSKAAGTFKIPHPDPIKAEQGKFLKHSFVESPTAGDNIYRFNVTTLNCSASIELPNYYSLLNANDQVYVNAKKHLGYGFGLVNNEQTRVDITTNTDGEYNVLLIGTRKDKLALDAWNGTEVNAVE